MREVRREGRRQKTSKRPNESEKQEESERVNEGKTHASKRLNECVRKEAVGRESENMGVK